MFDSCGCLWLSTSRGLIGLLLFFERVVEDFSLLFLSRISSSFTTDWEGEQGLSFSRLGSESDWNNKDMVNIQNGILLRILKDNIRFHYFYASYVLIGIQNDS